MGNPQPNLADIANTAGITESDLIRLVHESESQPKKRGRKPKPKISKPPGKKGRKVKLSNEMKMLILTYWVLWEKHTKDRKMEFRHIMMEALGLKDYSLISKLIARYNLLKKNGAQVLIRYNPKTNTQEVLFLSAEDIQRRYVGYWHGQLPEPLMLFTFPTMTDTERAERERAKQKRSTRKEK